MTQPSKNKKVKTRSRLPEAPPLHEEPIEGIEAGKEEVCEICGKAFKTHTELDRHMETMHENSRD